MIRVLTAWGFLCAVSYAGGIQFSDIHMIPNSYSAPRVERNANGAVVFHPACPVAFRTVSYGTRLRVPRRQVFRRRTVSQRQVVKPEVRDTAKTDSPVFGFQDRQGTVFLARKGEILRVGQSEFKVLGQRGDHVYLQHAETGRTLRARSTQ